MNLIAKLDDDTGIFDGGDSWVIRSITGDAEPDEVIKKSDKPLFPLAACLKWGAEAVDVDFLNALGRTER